MGLLFAIELGFQVSNLLLELQYPDFQSFSFVKHSLFYTGGVE